MKIKDSYFDDWPEDWSDDKIAHQLAYSLFTGQPLRITQYDINPIQSPHDQYMRDLQHSLEEVNRKTENTAQLCHMLFNYLKQTKRELDEHKNTKKQ